MNDFYRSTEKGTLLLIDEKVLGEVIAIYNRVEGQLYEMEFIPLSYIDFENKNLKKLILITESYKYYFNFNYFLINGNFKGKIEDYEEHRLDQFEKYSNLDRNFDIIITIPKIGFLNFHINYFIHDFFDNKNKRKDTIQKYSYKLKSLKEFYYKPYIKIDYQSNNIGFSTNGMNSFLYTRSSENNLNVIFQEALEKSNKILRVINILTIANSVLNSVHIKNDGINFINYYKTNQTGGFKYNNYGINENDYFAIIDIILDSVFKFDFSELELFWCITNRLIKIKKEDDITLLTVLLHSVLQLLFKHFTGTNKLNSEELLKKKSQ